MLYHLHHQDKLKRDTKAGQPDDELTKKRNTDDAHAPGLVPGAVGAGGGRQPVHRAALGTERY